ncbi:RAB6-interacting golgin [Amyelois transitella]|uniref:RAB6-interacting golgin n=1 Tax=Amyelois transitella TaxID=680683 RepID=UPI0029907DA5|nr:RAB6-interacting golgin [Amyelois transitella]
MSSTFSGFSEEDLQKIKAGKNEPDNAAQINTTVYKKIDKIGAKPKKNTTLCKLPLKTQNSDDAIDHIDFDKCKLSIKTPTSQCEMNDSNETNNNEDVMTDINLNEEVTEMKNGTDGPDLVRGVENYTEDELGAHKVKLEELQLKQKLMEEQNKKRKEMLAKALADRTKQTEEEVIRLEKIKKELQVLDGQFSQDVAVLRKKIDHACLCYAEAEKHYLKVEKEFLQAKIQLQKEKEKKELLTEHLCALITHNETRKAQKLETLMLELASDKRIEMSNDVKSLKTDGNNVKGIKKDGDDSEVTDDENPIIIDGVDQRSGKMVEFNL